MSTEPNNVTAPASGPPDLSKYSGAAWAKFIILSGFGIFVFFINITLPAYTNPFSGWETASRHTMLITHLSDFIRHSLWTGSIKAMPAIIWLFGVYCLWDIFKVNPAKAWKTTSVNKVFSVFKCIGFVLVTFTAINFYTSTFNSPGTGAEGVALWAAIPGTGWAPAFMGWYFEPILVGARSMAISPFVLSSILVMVTITIPLAAAFLPFLTNYGLVDFFGVFMRGVMRPLFKLPGRASVISVSALLASFVVAFIGAATEYNTGKMTQKEAMIIAYGLSSASIGFLFVLGANTGIMHIWNLYLWPAFFLVLIVT
ncbi:MAG: hypothetical protein FWD00_02535, partial [Clostridiales bacterium]|nr:hypothetical protein [Clostridiales bacterium]